MRKSLLSLSVIGFWSLSMLAYGLTACNAIEPENDPVTYGESYIPHLMSTDKAAYKPGESVRLSINSLPQEPAIVRYSYLGQVIKEESVSSSSWIWQPPTEDFRGYMASLHISVSGRDSVVATIGIDVSSEPSRFPRNGFLSAYGNMPGNEIQTILDELNRYHINYVQFQDWHWKHHHPLAGSATQPMDSWTDIISRNCYRTTVQSYIDGAHARGMLTLFYNLGYGCLEDFATDNVSREWLLYTDRNHTKMDNHPLGSPFKSAIYLANMHNPEWRDYLRARNDEVYAIFNFDGWQIDQLGPRPTVYDYEGKEVDLQASFGSFIANEKAAHAQGGLWVQGGQQIAAGPQHGADCHTRQHHCHPGRAHAVCQKQDQQRRAQGSRKGRGGQKRHRRGRHRRHQQRGPPPPGITATHYRPAQRIAQHPLNHHPRAAQRRPGQHGGQGAGQADMQNNSGRRAVHTPQRIP